MSKRRGTPSDYQPFDIEDIADAIFPRSGRAPHQPPIEVEPHVRIPAVASYTSRVGEVRARLDQYFAELERGGDPPPFRPPVVRTHLEVPAAVPRVVTVRTNEEVPPHLPTSFTVNIQGPPPPPLRPAARSVPRIDPSLGYPGMPGLTELRRAMLAPDAEVQVCHALSAVPAEGLLLLRLLTEVGSTHSLPLISEEARRLLGSILAQRAIQTLHERGLVLLGPSEAGLYVPPDLVPMLRSVLPPLCEPRALTTPAMTPVVSFEQVQRAPLELAVLALALWTVRPRMTTAGQLYRRDEERLRALLGSAFPLNERLGQLEDLELISGVEAMNVSPAAAEQLGQLRPVDLLRREAPQRFNGAARARTLGLLLRACRADPQAAWLSQEALERELRLGYMTGPFFLQGPTHLARMAANDLVELSQFAGLERCTSEGTTFFRLWPPLAGHAEPPPAPSAATRVHLQPSFEILVPPDAPLATILALGRVAELRRFDQVLTLQLTRASVSQAVEQGLQVADILQLLAQAAHAGVPQNVQASITGWVEQSGQARFAEGLVLVLREDMESHWRDDQALRTLLGRQLARGVFLVPSANRAAVDKRLRALGIQPSAEVLKSDEAPLSAAPPLAHSAWERYSETVLRRDTQLSTGDKGQSPAVQVRLWERVAAMRSAVEKFPRLATQSPEPFMLSLAARSPRRM